MGVRRSAAKWADLIAAWESSGRSARAFAEERGIAEASLRWWKSELARRARNEPPRRPSGTRAPAQRPITIARVVRDGDAAPPRETGGLDSLVVLVGSARIIVQPDFDAAHLRAIVRALGEAT